MLSLAKKARAQSSRVWKTVDYGKFHLSIPDAAIMKPPNETET